MMTQAFRLPDPGEGIHEVEILDVCVSVGQAVREVIGVTVPAL